MTFLKTKQKFLNLKCHSFFLLQIDNLQEQLQEKNHQLEDLRGKVKSLEADSKSSDNAMTSLEEALMEKDKSLMLLREQKEKEGVSLREDSEKHQRQTHELTAKIDALQKDVNDKEVLTNTSRGMHVGNMISRTFVIN